MRAKGGRGPGICLISIQIFVISSVPFYSENICGRQGGHNDTMQIIGTLKKGLLSFVKKEALPVAPTVSSKQVLSISCLLSAASGQIQELPEMISMPQSPLHSFGSPLPIGLFFYNFGMESMQNGIFILLKCFPPMPLISNFSWP